MREIKFRGLTKTKTQHWVYGYYCQVEGKEFIIPDDAELALTVPDSKYMDAISGMVEVIPETVGQFTGLKDKSGTEIYEGDIVDVKKDTMIGHFYKGKACNTFRRKVFWDKDAARFAHCCPCTYQAMPMNKIFRGIDIVPIEVIGNHFQNPELMEKE